MVERYMRSKNNRFLSALDKIRVYIQTMPVFGSVIKASIRSLQKENKDRSASVAYFTFLSLFPMLLGLVTIAGYFLDSVTLSSEIDRLLSDSIPSSADFVSRNLEALIRHRGAMGLISVVTLIWSGNKMFGALGRGLNQALNMTPGFNPLMNQLRNFALGILFTVLMFLHLVLTPLASVILAQGSLFFGVQAQSALSGIIVQTASVCSTTILIALVFWLVPYRLLSWKIVLPSAFITAVIHSFAKSILVVYLRNADQFETIYGSISSVIMLLLWLYWSAFLLMFGAELMGVYLTNVKK